MIIEPTANLVNERKGQMTLFVVIALAIVVVLVAFFVLRGQILTPEISNTLSPVYSYYEGCISDATRNAVSLAGSQGGYLTTPPYTPGSDFAPSSSELNFLGFSVPYWTYVSANGVVKEDHPSKVEIERELAAYLDERVAECDFEPFYNQGFEIESDTPEVEVRINDLTVEVTVNNDLTVAKEEERTRRSNHRITLNSKFGKFYDIANRIHEKQQKEAVFEEYGIDVLRLYAPVDGVINSCSGKHWKTDEVVNDIKQGLAANMQTLKFKGDYYTLANEEQKYYEIDLGTEIDESVNVLYTERMPTKIEIVGEGADDALLIASPVGTQEGMGIMGFCYAPYHFVYDVHFPVLIQIFDGEELFQFPTVAVIDNNVAREAVVSELDLEIETQDEFDICSANTQDVTINLYDTTLGPADANLSYQCLNQRCRLGQTNGGTLTTQIPSCYNGQLKVQSENYADQIHIYSSNSQNLAELILDREYKVTIDLSTGGVPFTDGTGLLTFVKEDGTSVSAALPDTESIRLSEGSYDVQAYVYGATSLTIPSSTRTQCYDAPRSGVLGIFGSTKEECVDITLPAQEIEQALIGGGTSQIFILENQLQDGKIDIDVGSLALPRTLEELQQNYATFDTLQVVVS